MTVSGIKGWNKSTLLLGFERCNCSHIAIVHCVRSKLAFQELNGFVSGTIIQVQFRSSINARAIIAQSTTLMNQSLVINGSIYVKYGYDLTILSSTIIVNGNLTSQNNNGLTISDSTIYFNNTSPSAFSVQAQGKNVKIINSRILNMTNTYNWFSFNFGNITLKNVEFRGFGNAKNRNTARALFNSYRANYPQSYISLQNVGMTDMGGPTCFTQSNNVTVRNLTMTDMALDIGALFL